MAIIGQKGNYVEWVDHANPGPGVEAFALDRNMAKRVAIVDWDSRQQFVRDVLGYAQKVNGGGGAGFISRSSPHAHPDWVDPNGQPFLFAVSCDPIVGKGVPDDRNMKGAGRTGGADSDIARYNKAFVTVNYEAPPWDVLGDNAMRAAGLVDANGNADESTLTRYVIKEEDPTGQMITMPKGSMRFTNQATAGAVLQESQLLMLAPPKLIPYWNVKITHVLLPASVVGTKLVGGGTNYETTLGKVNDADFPASGPYAGAFPQGKLLYVAAKITPHRSPLGLRVYNVQHFFQYAIAARHNQVPYIDNTGPPGKLGWIELSTDGTSYADTIANNGKHIYDAADFTKLFKPT